MTSGLLEVPAPDGSGSDLDHAAVLLESSARDIHLGARDLSGIGTRLGGAWEGAAGDAFVVRQAEVTLAVERLAGFQNAAARELRAYAREWEAAERASETALQDLHDAGERYRVDAQAALRAISVAIDAALSSNPVGELFSHVVDGAVQIQQRLLSWQPPPLVPTLVPVAADVVEDLSESAVSAMVSGLGFAATHVLSGIETVLDFIGGLVGGAVARVRQVEEIFVAAVAAAQGLARQAMRRLFEFGVETAARLGRLAVEFAVDVTAATLQGLIASGEFLIAVGRGLLAYAQLQLRLLAGAGALIVLLGRAGSPFEMLDRGRRRIDDADLADEGALQRWLLDTRYKATVIEHSTLADAAYETSGAPGGWTRLQNFNGPEGFAASAFENEATGEVVLSFRGTQQDSLQDWIQDAANAADSPTPQGAWAVQTAREMQRQHGDSVTYTGHSLGGSLASIASITTGGTATTYNAAGVGEGNRNLAMLTGGAGASEKQITNFHTTNDVLTHLQEQSPMYSAAGAQITIESNTGNPINAHGLDAFVWPQVKGAVDR